MFEQGASLHKATCSIHTRMEDEDVTVQEEANLEKDELDEVRPMKTTLNFDKKTETTEEHSE